MPGPVSWMSAVFPGPSSTVTAQEKELPQGAATVWKWVCCCGEHRQLVALGSALSKGWCWGCLSSLREMETFYPEPILNGAEPYRSAPFAPVAFLSPALLTR